MLLDTAVGTCSLINILVQALQPQRCMNGYGAVVLTCACSFSIRGACTFAAWQISTMRMLAVCHVRCCKLRMQSEML